MLRFFHWYVRDIDPRDRDPFRSDSHHHLHMCRPFGLFVAVRWVCCTMCGGRAYLGDRCCRRDNAVAACRYLRRFRRSTLAPRAPSSSRPAPPSAAVGGLLSAAQPHQPALRWSGLPLPAVGQGRLRRLIQDGNRRAWVARALPSATGTSRGSLCLCCAESGVAPDALVAGDLVARFWPPAFACASVGV